MNISNIFNFDDHFHLTFHVTFPSCSGHMIKHPRMGTTVKGCVDQIPAISLASSIQPITRTVLRVRLTIKPEFQWNDKVHGSTSEPWWIWVEDPDNNHIYHSEYFLLHKKQVCTSLYRFFGERHVEKCIQTISSFSFRS